MWAQIVNFFSHPAISTILIAAISFFNPCKELKIAQATNSVSNDVNKEKKNTETNKQATKLKSKHVVLTCQRSVRNQFYNYARIWLSGIILARQ